MNPRAKFRANTCNSKRVMGDKRNSKSGPSPSWIYYYCQFWLHGPFTVMAGYTPVKLH